MELNIENLADYFAEKNRDQHLNSGLLLQSPSLQNSLAIIFGSDNAGGPDVKSGRDFSFVTVSSN